MFKSIISKPAGRREPLSLWCVQILRGLPYALDLNMGATVKHNGIWPSTSRKPCKRSYLHLLRILWPWIFIQFWYSLTHTRRKARRLLWRAKCCSKLTLVCSDNENQWKSMNHFVLKFRKFGEGSKARMYFWHFIQGKGMDWDDKNKINVVTLTSGEFSLWTFALPRCDSTRPNAPLALEAAFCEQPAPLTCEATSILVYLPQKSSSPQSLESNLKVSGKWPMLCCFVFFHLLLCL